MSFVATAIGGSAALSAGGSIFSGIMGASGERKKAAALRAAGERGASDILQSVKDANAQTSEYNTMARGDLSPFRGYGVEAGNTLADLLMGRRGMGDLLKESDLFRFQSDIGSRNINRELAARGLYGSGAGLETLQRFNNQLSAEEGQRTFDRLFNMTQLGEHAASNMASMTNQAGMQIGSNTLTGGMNAAQMRFTGATGAAQAQANATRLIGDMGKGIFDAAAGGLQQYGNFRLNKPIFDAFSMTGGGGEKSLNASHDSLYAMGRQYGL